MTETKTYTVELPKDFVQRMLPLKPQWLSGLTDEAFLTLVIAHGNYDGYREELQQAETSFKELNERLGLSTKPGKEDGRKRSKPGKAISTAGEIAVPPFTGPSTKDLRTPATT